MKLNSDIIGGDGLGVYQGFFLSLAQSILVEYICWHLEAMFATSLNFCFMQLSTCSKCKRIMASKKKS
jgi:hypothetical protein